MQQLLSEETLFDDVSSTREKIDSMDETKQTNLATMEAIDMNIDSFMAISRFCGSLYLAILSLTSLNPLYNLSLEAFIKLMDFKEEEESEEAADGGDAATMVRSFGTFKLTTDEHTVVSSLASKVDLNILRTDLPILGLILAITVAEVKGLVVAEERDRLAETLNKLVEGGEEDEVSDREGRGRLTSTQVTRLQPCLSEAEARVVAAVVREAEEAGEELGVALAR